MVQTGDPSGWEGLLLVLKLHWFRFSRGSCSSVKSIIPSNRSVLAETVPATTISDKASSVSASVRASN